MCPVPTITSLRILIVDGDNTSTTAMTDDIMSVTVTWHIRHPRALPVLWRRPLEPTTSFPPPKTCSCHPLPVHGTLDSAHHQPTTFRWQMNAFVKNHLFACARPENLWFLTNSVKTWDLFTPRAQCQFLFCWRH